MNEENNNPNSRIPELDFMAALQQRIAQKKVQSTTSQSPYPTGPFDPHQLMVNRRQQNSGEISADYPVQNWPVEDIKKLEDFCRKHGILGFNCGNMSPLAALGFLKQKLGVIDDFPKTEGYGPNYPYTEAMKKRILLSG